MNEFYNVLTEHDEVLDGVEYSIIAVNLPGRQAVYMLERYDADLLQAAEASDSADVPRFW
ncbi:MAG: hypothetical protein E6559_23305 [Pantoea sp.]|uniref:hypothetical protein n=1 Tax=Pantoea septica TaxID=472695 RepID=UPI001C11AF93|nr:hypothetical protein [Pantoea septica]MBU5377456.1 hypothetical protein [Pantoea septica]MDU5835516.1 hypothetical protein [Pantoea sp.]MDU6442776.1 hypothetical protein [Pantoea sp.]